MYDASPPPPPHTLPEYIQRRGCFSFIYLAINVNNAKMFWCVPSPKLTLHSIHNAPKKLKNSIITALYNISQGYFKRPFHVSTKPPQKLSSMTKPKKNRTQHIALCHQRIGWLHLSFYIFGVETHKMNLPSFLHHTTACTSLFFFNCFLYALRCCCCLYTFSHARPMFRLCIILYYNTS